MSQLLINQVLTDLDRLRAVSGTNRQTVVREAFKDLLKNSAKQHELVLLLHTEVRILLPQPNLIFGRFGALIRRAAGRDCGRFY